jgi:hypothetical protein
MRNQIHVSRVNEPFHVVRLQIKLVGFKNIFCSQKCTSLMQNKTEIGCGKGTLKFEF